MIDLSNPSPVPLQTKLNKFLVGVALSEIISNTDRKAIAASEARFREVDREWTYHSGEAARQRWIAALAEFVKDQKSEGGKLVSEFGTKERYIKYEMERAEPWQEVRRNLQHTGGKVALPVLKKLQKHLAARLIILAEDIANVRAMVTGPHPEWGRDQVEVTFAAVKINLDVRVKQAEEGKVVLGYPAAIIREFYDFDL